MNYLNKRRLACLIICTLVFTNLFSVCSLKIPVFADQGESSDIGINEVNEEGNNASKNKTENDNKTQEEPTNGGESSDGKNYSSKEGDSYGKVGFESNKDNVDEYGKETVSKGERKEKADEEIKEETSEEANKDVNEENNEERNENRSEEKSNELNNEKIDEELKDDSSEKSSEESSEESSKESNEELNEDVIKDEEQINLLSSNSLSSQGPSSGTGRIKETHRIYYEQSIGREFTVTFEGNNYFGVCVNPYNSSYIYNGALTNMTKITDAKLRKAAYIVSLYYSTYGAIGKIGAQRTLAYYAGWADYDSFFPYSSYYENVPNRIVNTMNTVTSVPDTFECYISKPVNGAQFHLVWRTIPQPPPDSLVNIEVLKISANTKDPVKDDFAVFKVEFWEDKQTPSGAASRTWHFKTDESGLANFNRSDLLVSGYGTNSALYLNPEKTHVAFPEGVMRITEEKAPNGFNKVDTQLIVNFKKNSKNTLDVSWSKATLNDRHVDFEGTGSYNSKVSYTRVALYNYEKMDDTNLVILKVDDFGQPISDLDGAQARFKVEFFRDKYSTVASSGFNKEPSHYWIYTVKTGEDDTDSGVINLNRSANMIVEESDQWFLANPNRMGFPGGTLRITEITPPKGYKKSDSVLYAECKREGDTLKVRWVDDTKNLSDVTYVGYEPYKEGASVYADKITLKNLSTGKVRIIKEASDSDLVLDNSLYTLEGAEFGIFDKKELAEKGSRDDAIEILTTDKEGKTKTSKSLKAKTYYVRELKSPRGYRVNGQVIPVEVKIGTTEEFTVTNEPVTYPINLNITKVSEVDGEPIKDSPAVFKMEYFMNNNWEGKANKTWYLKSNSDGKIMYDSSHLADDLDSSYVSDELFKDGKFPLGTVSVTEVKAPTGYRIKNEPLKWKFDIEEVIAPEEKVLSAYINEELEPRIIKTIASDIKTGNHVGEVSKTAGINDILYYENLIPGRDYRFDVTLKNAKTGETVGLSTFTTKVEERTGTITMPEISLDSSSLKGESLVVTETLTDLKQSKVVARHEDLNDKDQTIYYPDVHTSAKDGESNRNEGRARDEAKIIDTVSLYNLIPGETYTVKGVLMDKDENAPFVDGKGNEITSEKTFKAEAENMSLNLEFKFDGSNVLGKTLVVFEDLITNEVLIASHRDLDDKNQTVTVPKIGTSARDGLDGDKNILNKENQKIIDTIKYEKLEPNTKYHVYLTVFDKTANKLTEIKTDKEFTSSESGTGEFEMEVTFDGKKFQGHTLVVFEEIMFEEHKIAEHKDPEDKEQTIYVKTDAPLTGDDNNLNGNIWIFIVGLSMTILVTKLRGKIKNTVI